jgi:hypothetical protein
LDLPYDVFMSFVASHPRDRARVAGKCNALSSNEKLADLTNSAPRVCALYKPNLQNAEHAIFKTSVSMPFIRVAWMLLFQCAMH